ncbi:hypothetical protein A6770_12785 [Nostoc minutum NIES-26]|uniref:Uncharacterized protein n=1 Tax=Nostoc minutum NIES-26 TaxID=1844469 RepID=A0A367RSW5_9NOSO|nr:hypothetical protein A6770_12785 [Nostoc minutum NIES-26]
MVRKSKPNGVLHGEEKIKLAAQIINKLWGIRQRYLQPGSGSFLLNIDTLKKICCGLHANANNYYICPQAIAII